MREGGHPRGFGAGFGAGGFAAGPELPEALDEHVMNEQEMMKNEQGTTKNGQGDIQVIYGSYMKSRWMTGIPAIGCSIITHNATAFLPHTEYLLLHVFVIHKAGHSIFSSAWSKPHTRRISDLPTTCILVRPGGTLMLHKDSK